VESHTTETLLRWIVLVPLFGAAVGGILNRRLPKKVAGLLACGAVGVSFALSVTVFLRLTRMPAAERFVSDTMGTWIGFGKLQIDLGFSMDPLSGVMALVVTGVGFLIHIYSLGYMAHDEGFSRFFAYMNLFIFAMMTLVLGENLLMLFVGWEGVGLCSYLLISFWFNDEANAAAGKKAFIVNRIGDFGFLLGIFLIGTTLLPHLADGEGLFSFRTLQHHAGIMAPVATAICLLLFLGATGKSAQIPLYIWLPDAMAGPTPVSALIHAATMVTAGVYMVARMNFLFVLSPTAMTVVAAVGVVTAVFAATIALTQNDIKKVLAYSTVSQLGYMMLACGVGAFGIAIFHVMTHAFFKALLFLGSGSVIHAMSNEQDMRVMGGLKNKLPITYWTFLVGTLALAGIFPLAGFFSKDEILWKTFSSDLGGVLPWALGFLAAGRCPWSSLRCCRLSAAGSAGPTSWGVAPGSSSGSRRSSVPVTEPLRTELLPTDPPGPCTTPRWNGSWQGRPWPGGLSVSGWVISSTRKRSPLPRPSGILAAGSHTRFCSTSTTWTKLMKVHSFVRVTCCRKMFYGRSWMLV